MAYYSGGIADSLSREFRAMSSERDRQWRTSATAFGRCTTGGQRWSDPMSLRTPPVADLAMYPTPRDGRYRTDSSRRRRSAPEPRGRYEAPPSASSSYSYSYSYGSRSSGSSSTGENSSDSDEVEVRRGGRAAAARGRGDGKRQQRTGSLQRRQPARPSRQRNRQSAPPPNAPPAGVIRWVEGGRRGSGGAGNGGDQQVVVMNPTEPLRPVVSAQMPPLQPSGLLRRVIEAVAHYRRVPTPTSVPAEVILAFDEYVSHGSTMLKFVPHGPPHARYFAVRFLDVVAGSMRIGGRARVHAQEPSVPHAVLAWYHGAASRHMIRFLPLHDLIEVKADGTDHHYVRRRTVQPGVLRGPRSGLVTNYVRAEFILQFRFASRLSRAEETLALMAANRTQYLAWLVVGSFISQIGDLS